MNGRNISLLKRASKEQVKKVVQAAAEKAPSAEQVGESLGSAGRTFAHGVGKYLSATGRVGGAMAKGLGAGEGGKAMGKALGMIGGVALPVHLIGKTRIGQKVESAAARGIGAAGRGAQRFVDPYDPYAGQY